MQALKILVVVMGLGIVGIVAVIVVVLVQRTGAGGGAEGLGEVAFDLPAGCVLADAAAAEGRLVLRLDGPAGAGCQQAVVVDLESGELLGRVTAKPAP